ncbi:MAG: hypothetical protein ACXW2E_01855 [Nitrososphaeraceae archaeon]
MNKSLSEKDFDKLVQRTYKVCFRNSDTDFEKVLWRMSQGCRREALHILKSVAAAYNIHLTEELFDHVVAEANDGIEVEWDSWDWEDPVDDSFHKRRYEWKVHHDKEIDDYFAGIATRSLKEIVNS